MSDSGATVNIIPEVERNRLNLTAHPLPTPITIRYGKEGSTSTCTQFVKGKGLIKQMVIVPDAAMTLISTRSFTSQGLEVRYTDTTVSVWDPIDNIQVISGNYSPTSKLWEFRLQELLDHPGIQHKSTAHLLRQDSGVSFANFDAAEANINAAFATQSNDNMIDHLQKLYCGAPNSTLAHMVKSGWVTNIPGKLTPHQILSRQNSIESGKGHQRKVNQHHSKKKTIHYDVMQMEIGDQYECEEGETILHVTIDKNGYEIAHISVEVDDDGTDEWGESINTSHADATPLQYGAFRVNDNDFHNQEYTEYALDMDIDLTQEQSNDDNGDGDLVIYGIQDVSDAQLASHDELKKRTMWIDGTGDYTSTSSDGSNLVMLFALGGYIHAEAIKNTSASEQVNATEHAINFFIDRGQIIQRQVLDNLCPAAVTDLFQRRKIPYQLVPPNNHRYNRAEPAVGIWKNRWIAMRAGLDPEFPLATQWHRLLPRVEIALNCTIPSIIDKTKSAWQYLHSMPYDFSKHPLALPACKVLVYEQRPKRQSWSDHGTVGWCLEPSLRHFRAQRVYIPTFESERITSSLAYYPHRGYIPGYSNIERLAAALSEVSLTLDRVVAGKQVPVETTMTVTQHLRDLREVYAPLFDLLELPRDSTNPPPHRPDPIEQPMPLQPLVINLHQPSSLQDDSATLKNNEMHKQAVNKAARERLFSQQRATLACDDYDDEVIALALQYALIARKERNEDTPTIHRVLKDPKLLAEWMPAISDEINNLIKIGALVKCSPEEATAPGNELLPNIIQLKRKRNPDRTVKKLKARLCMNGNIELHQFHMFQDPTENYAPNANFDTILQLLCFSVRRGWNVCGLDITMAYVMTDFNRSKPVYTYTQLPGTERQYYRLGRMIYGLPDAGRAWYECFKDFLVQEGYKCSIHDPCLFVKIASEDDGIAIAVTTNDCLISHSNNAAGSQHVDNLLKAMTAKGWKYTFDEVVHDMLGIQFNWLQEIPGALLLRTPSKIMDVKEYFFKGVADEDIPKVYDSLLPGWTPEASQVSDSNPAIDATVFRRGFGLFPYNAKIRNDTRLPFCYLATKMQEPTELDYAAAKHLAAYLWTTRQLGLCFHPASSVGGDTATDLLQATDGSWDPGFRDSKSVIASLIKIGEANDPSAPFSATTNKESTCSMSATVMEAKALMQGSGRVIQARGIAEDLLRTQRRPTPSLCDSESALSRINRLLPVTKALKPVARIFNGLGDMVKNREIEPILTRTKDQLADPLTKKMGALDNLRSLPTLQGQQPAITQIFEEYAQRRSSRRPSSSMHLVASAISSDGVPYLPYHLLHDDEDDLEANEQLAYLNRIAQRSETVPRYLSNEDPELHNFEIRQHIKLINGIIYRHRSQSPISKVSTSNNNNRVKFSLA